MNDKTIIVAISVSREFITKILFIPELLLLFALYNIESPSNYDYYLSRILFPDDSHIPFQGELFQQAEEDVTLYNLDSNFFDYTSNPQSLSRWCPFWGNIPLRGDQFQQAEGDDPVPSLLRA